MKEFCITHSLSHPTICLFKNVLQCRISVLDNSPTNKLAVSQVAGWSSRGLVNSPTENFLNHGKTTLYLYTKPKSNLTYRLLCSVE